jgi:P-type E1-E2 ATPase
MLYRASPEDKHMLVAGLKQLKSRGKLKNIAMTGDSISDAPALRAADVGLCMQDGCDVAKDSADFVILNNDYKSVFNAARWGRNIFDSIRKFLQFQLTVAISLTLVLIISSLTLGRCPFTVMQILWINLVMDVLAAAALATESPHPTELPEIQKN